MICDACPEASAPTGVPTSLATCSAGEKDMRLASSRHAAAGSLATSWPSSSSIMSASCGRHALRCSRCTRGQRTERSQVARSSPRQGPDSRVASAAARWPSSTSAERSSQSFSARVSRSAHRSGSGPAVRNEKTSSALPRAPSRMCATAAPSSSGRSSAARAASAAACARIASTRPRRSSSAARLRSRPRAAAFAESACVRAGWSSGARTSRSRQSPAAGAAASASVTSETSATSTSFSAMSSPADACTRTVPLPSVTAQLPETSVASVTSGRQPAMLSTSSETVAPVTAALSAPTTRTASCAASA